MRMLALRITALRMEALRMTALHMTALRMNSTARDRPLCFCPSALYRPCSALDAADLVQLGMEGDALQQAATCYVDYCHKMLVSARDSVIETYVVNPVAAFASARANKLDIEHVGFKSQVLDFYM